MEADMNPRSSLPIRLVLASSSPYRKELLAKLGIPFEAASPDIDESALSGETPAQQSKRLAGEKAMALRQRFPSHLIIGSDQVATLEGIQLGKPGNHARTVAQLCAASGKKVEFLTSVCVFDSATGKAVSATDRTVVHFRTLTAEKIKRYVDKERPYDCAGGFKSESLGVALIKRLETGDPNALVGLPLIRLVGLLEEFGLEIPGD
jgi:septum formation protein